METFGRVFGFLMFVAFITFATSMAVLCTAFAGSIHHAPKWYLIYLGITQAIPIIVFGIAFLIMAIQIVLNKKYKVAGIIVGISAAIYMVSFFVIFNVPYFMKALGP